MDIEIKAISNDINTKVWNIPMSIELTLILSQKSDHKKTIAYNFVCAYTATRKSSSKTFGVSLTT